MTSPALLVLDGQGVVFNDPFADFLVQAAKVTGQCVHTLQQRWKQELRVPFWSGLLSEADMWRTLLGGQELLDLPAVLENAYAPGPAAPFLSRWSQRVPLWLLSNHRTAWLLPRLARFSLAVFFERILVSDALGFVKPEERSFRPLLEANCEPGSVVFVDDHLCNVNTATNLCFCALHADRAGKWISQVEAMLFQPALLCPNLDKERKLWQTGEEQGKE